MEGEVLTTEPPGMPPGQVVLTLPRRHRAAQHSLEPPCSDLILCPLVDTQPDLRVLSGHRRERLGCRRSLPALTGITPNHPLPFPTSFLLSQAFWNLKKGKKRKPPVLRHLEDKEVMKEATVRGGVHLEKGFSNSLNFDS